MEKNTEIRTCSKCKESKKLSLEFFRFSKKEQRWFRVCRSCENKRHKEYLKETNYYENNKERILNNNKVNYYSNIEKRKEYHKKYYINNKEKIIKRNLKYVENNSEKTRKYQNKYKKDRRKLDPAFRLRNDIGKYILLSLKKGNCKKNNSVWSYLPYSPDQLRSHLESQFEPWMTWDNHGVLSKKKRTWQIDHIVPQSKLPFDSMAHPNFLKCWALENLRPLESILNLKKGNK